MARPREVSGLDCDGSFGAAAARVVEVRAEEVFAHAEGVLDLDDIEPLHDMRVATRRLRAAMEMFRPCFPRKRYRRAMKPLKALADALGERRDRDVAIGSLGELAAAASAADRGRLEILIAKLDEERQPANEALAPFVAEARLAELRARLDELATGGSAMKARRVAGLDAVGPAARQRGADRRDQARGAERARRRRRSSRPGKRPSTTCGSPPNGCATCSRSPPAASAPRRGATREAAKQLQGVLGEIHDCDVMLPRVAGIESVEALLRTRRELLFARFRELWSELEPRASRALGAPAPRPRGAASSTRPCGARRGRS